MAQIISVRLQRNDNTPWGFRLQGGKDFGSPLVIQKVNGQSIAERAGLLAGDAVLRVNSTDVFNLRHKDAQDTIVRAGPNFEITVQRGAQTWKPAVTPTGALPSPYAANNATVTKTSLAANQKPAKQIGSGHNTQAKPFVNGNADSNLRLVNKQYNSPLALYSEESIAETLSAQTEVLPTGALGVNFKKNEKHYNAEKSEVLKMLQEAENEPKEPEPETEQRHGVVTSPAPVSVAGLRHVTAPITTSPSPSAANKPLAPGQNICADCERLIVGVFVRIKDKNLHVECFKCSTCGTSLKNVGYYNINNKLYCDIHAKLAARSNQPGPNMVPITISPGSKIPAGTISAALSSHSVGPLSPSSNTTAPFSPSSSVLSGPRPFSSNPAPLSPLSPASAPFTTTNHHAATLPRTNAVQNPPVENSPNVELTKTELEKCTSLIWPPKKDEEELPTATPLYVPPGPSNPIPIKSFKSTKQEQQQVYVCESQMIQKTESSTEFSEQMAQTQTYQHVDGPYPDENASKMQTQISQYSAEVANINTGRRSAMECAEQISDTVNTQILVENIKTHLQRPPSPPPPPDVEDIKTEQIPDTKLSNDHIKKHEQMKITHELQKNTQQITECQTKLQELKQTGQSQSKQQICIENPQEICPQICTQDVCIKTDAKTLQSEKICIENSQQICSQVCTQDVCIKKNQNDKICTENPQQICPQICTQDVCIDKEIKREKTQKIASNISNPVPKQWKSQFVSALETAPQTNAESESVELPDTKLPIQPSFLTSGLTIAPARPFTPVQSTSNEVIPLPEETKPYLPPEFPIKPLDKPIEKFDPKTPLLDALTVAPLRPYTPVTKEIIAQQDDLIKDLPPGPHPDIGLLNALTIAPERPFTPIWNQNVESTPVESSNIPPPPPLPPQSQKPSTEFKPVVSQSQLEMTQSFPPVTNELKSVFKPMTKFGASQVVQKMDEESSTVEKQSVSKPTTTVSASQMIETSQEKYESCTTIEKHEEKSCTLKSQSETYALHKPTSIPTYQRCLSPFGVLQKPPAKGVSEHDKIYSEEYFKELAVQVAKDNEAALEEVSQPKPPQVLISEVPKSNFQPITDKSTRALTPSSARPARAVTPSLINHPAPIIPHYQKNLVPSEHLAPETHLYDPKSPEISRAPTPRLDRSRSPIHQAPAPSPVRAHAPRLKPAGQVAQTVQKEQHRSTSGLTTTAFSENIRAQTANLRANATSQQQSVDTFSNGLVQVERKKTVVEEYERNRKEVDIERAISKTTIGVSSNQSQSVIKEVQSAHGLKQYEVNLGKPKPITPATVQKPVNIPQQLPPASSQKPVVTPPVKPFNVSQQFTPASSSAFKAVPQKPIPPQNACTLSKNKVSSSLPPSVPSKTPQMSSTNVQPIIPTNAGAATVSAAGSKLGGSSGGGNKGKQTGAIPFSPRRGRGILNKAVGVGSRVPLCGHCNSYVRGPFITALGKIWCPEHFICATPSCRRPLQDLGFVEEKGQLYCEYCFEQYLAPTCDQCHSKVKGDCLKAIGKHFHPECFNCAYCGKLFGNNPFFLEDGLPYCEADWNELFTTKCFACGFPVEAGDRWVEALNNNYHSQCFNCTMCKKNLEGESFYAKGGRPYCKNHAR